MDPGSGKKSVISLNVLRVVKGEVGLHGAAGNLSVVDVQREEVYAEILKIERV